MLGCVLGALNYNYLKSLQPLDVVTVLNLRLRETWKGMCNITCPPKKEQSWDLDPTCVY